MSITDHVIRGAAAVAVMFVAGIAAVISYGHAYELVRTHGESGATAQALPLTVDGLIITCSLVLLDAARRRQRAPLLAWVLLGCGIVATLGANVAHGLNHGAVGAIIAGWPALVAVGSFEMLSRLIRGGQVADVVPATVEPAAEIATPAGPVWWPPFVPDPVPAEVGNGTELPALDPPAGDEPVPVPGDVPDLGPDQVRAAKVFAEELAAGAVPSFRTVKKRMRVGQDKADEIRAYLKTLAHN